MSSASFGDLAARLVEVRTLSLLDPARGGDVTRAPVSNAVNRACLVMLSAHLEGFLEDLVTEALDYVVGAGTSVERLPLLLRSLHVEAHLRQMEPIRDRNARAPRIEKMFIDESPMWTAGMSVKPSMVRSNLVCAEMRNPGTREISSFLSLVGVEFDAYLDDLGAAPVFGRINGLIGKRNAVAHGDPAATATFGDVDGYVGVVEQVAQHVDAAVAASVKGICGHTHLPW